MTYHSTSRYTRLEDVAKFQQFFHKILTEYLFLGPCEHLNTFLSRCLGMLNNIGFIEVDKIAVQKDRH